MLSDFALCLDCARRRKDLVDKAYDLSDGGFNRYFHKPKRPHPRTHVLDYDGTIVNAMLHCIWICEVSKACAVGGMPGWACGDIVGTWHETPSRIPVFRRYIGFGTPPREGPEGEIDKKFRCMDNYNNRRGVNCSSSPDCYTCCRSKALAGQLAVVVHYKREGLRPAIENCSKYDSVIVPKLEFDVRQLILRYSGGIF
jgi:hypothetical protein